MRRIWAMPTMEVHGVVGGYTGPGIKTIIPPHAAVKISCRLVPKQDPKKILKLMRAFVKERNSDVEFVEDAAMYPYKAPVTGPLADAVRSAMKFAFGREPVFVREGGSIGAVISMERYLKCPVLFLGLSLLASIPRRTRITTGAGERRHGRLREVLRGSGGSLAPPS
jgi:acetylornithine deacetylase/succinyl-diaminopimelate desuccinylase-like protein